MIRIDVEPEERDEHGRFLPGTSGNPGGRPKGSVSLATALQRELLRRQESGQAGIEAVAARLVDLALAGDLRAVREIGDRIDGKPKQAVDLATQEPIVLAPVTLRCVDHIGE
jgi:hypothetical protein